MCRLMVVQVDEVLLLHERLNVSGDTVLFTTSHGPSFPTFPSPMGKSTFVCHVFKGEVHLDRGMRKGPIEQGANRSCAG